MKNMTPFLKFQKKFRKPVKVSEKKQTKSGIKSRTNFVVKALIIVFLVGSIFLYLLQINSLATKGFKIQKLEQKVNVLQTKNKKLSLRAIKLRSMAELNEKVRNLDMVPISQYSYLEATSTGMARR
jgi:hypothetical protein